MTKKIMDKDGIRRALTRMSYEIVERNQGTENLVLIGIKTRGWYLAQRIADRLKQIEGHELPVVSLDISGYRDDLSQEEKEKAMESFETPVDLTGKTVILVDDVLYTGRTIRAALDAIMDQGRPAKIALAVLIDRGHRELPIRPDFIGKNIPTAASEDVQVYVQEADGEDAVKISEGE
ncbi:bifunctional pyr operon transcriptional regulator/uracil phosphoribosyltransferase PyrR [Lactobacillus porci]|jgi:pyrimidine operon attenuation protein/uracil phosphoribosyltransferase|uniref:Bifunctional protein PyrR n=1 Tax=Lactobacillus porci TaxID=2012477 RepID=A0A6A8MDT0_9LACO|nr:bifunctional pyr operon transcriptional regulator/uracil phosphoribosyltransferase PyrR [Lactobacillus porci]MDD6416904.1 bifunctional pyr operon transcriptional regulator/uracil phosphoribosyltransferase PyrR [Lactobacillus porci]MDD6719634.1 bifunctional pyr operon transcriptional regulator/uracil phosphoribosyltransferase PyrR [Lactobacillus porci]MST86941.1 bifunctional pyr operon transcriptional regulator/uracil phosphoribosyltransferase PyrR [Lactobacillus porci]